METAIFHIGNAGLFFYRNGTGILIDGIYDADHDVFNERYHTYDSMVWIQTSRCRHHSSW